MGHHSHATVGNYAMVVLITVASLAFFYVRKGALRLKSFWLFNFFRKLSTNNEEQGAKIRANMQTEFCNAQHRYSETGTLVMLVIYTVMSIMVLIQDLVLAEFFPGGVQQYSGPWYSSWSAMGFGLLLVARWPRLHSAMRIPVSYLLATLIVTSFILPFAGRSKSDVLFADSLIRVALIVLAPIGGMMSCTLGSAFYSVVAAISFNMADGSCEVGNLSYTLWQLTLGVGTTLVGSYCIIGYMTNEVKDALKRKEVVAEREAVSSLLTIVCDAVVELDDEGQIVSPMLGLSNLLLRGTQMRIESQPGTKLLDLLHTDEEKQRLEDFMRTSENKSAVGIFDMRDSRGKPVTMEVFKVVLVSSWASSSKYLIGIKEHFDFGHGNSRKPKSQRRGPAAPSASCRVGDEPGMPYDTTISSFGSQTSGFTDPDELSMDSRTRARFEEGHMPTSQKALELTLLLLMETWRLGTQSRRFCCSFHAACSKLLLSAARIKKMHCNRHFKSTDGLQCPKCGIEELTTSPYCFICEDDEQQGDHHCIVCEGIEQVFPSLEEPGRPQVIAVSSGRISSRDEPGRPEPGRPQDSASFIQSDVGRRQSADIATCVASELERHASQSQQCASKAWSRLSL